MGNNFVTGHDAAPSAGDGPILTWFHQASGLLSSISSCRPINKTGRIVSSTEHLGCAGFSADSMMAIFG
jgi:hypothetical protein